MCNEKNVIENSSNIQTIHKKKTNKSVHDLYGSKYKSISDRQIKGIFNRAIYLLYLFMVNIILYRCQLSLSYLHICDLHPMSR